MSTVGELGRQLRAYHRGHGLICQRVGAFLLSLYDGTTPEWEYLLDEPDLQIDIWGVVDSPAAAHALFTAGFDVVTAHPHPRSRFLSCGVGSCPPRRRP